MAKKDFIINFLYISIIIGLIFLGLKYIVVWFIPFILGFLIAFILRPVSDGLAKLMRVKGKVAAAFAAFFFYITVAAILWVLSTIIISQLSIFLKALPQIYFENVQPLVNKFNTQFVSFLSNASPNLASSIDQIFTAINISIQELLFSLSGSIVSGITSFAKKVPFYILTLMFTIISSVLICVDYQNVSLFVMRQFSKRTQKSILEVKDFLVESLISVFKAYVIIMAITFVELSIGLWFLKIPYFLPIAMGIAIVDLLPLVGSGIALAPWALFELLRGNYSLAVGLLILWAVISVMREIIEPKIIGEQIGLHPLITLIAMFIGIQLFGFMGLILAPIFTILIKNLNDNGKIKLFK